MKTKFIYLLIAIALFSFAGNAQFRSISIIGSGVGGWNVENDHDLQTSDGITYTLVDLHIGEGEIKFREGHCWESACAVGTVNVFGWGPVSNTDNGFTVGTSNTAPGQNGPNIKATAGVWNVTFHLDTQSWEFTPGTPNPTVKLFGSAVDPTTGILMGNPSADGINYVLKKTPFAGGGTAQFELNLTPATTPATLQVLAGSAWPTGIADSDTALIPVDATPHDYDVSFNLTTGVYTFVIGTFPQIAIIGGGAGGWPNGVGEIPGPIDINPMTTTDGDAYTISHLALTTDGIKFRLDNAWNSNWGGDTWPSGSNSGGNIPAVGGNYNGTFNKTTGAYAFTLNTIAVIGSGAGGWPGADADVNVMTSNDGVNYTLNGIVLTTGEIKFRENNGWDTNWGGAGFPSGIGSGSNISCSAGTYNLTFNRVTGDYSFVSPVVGYTYYADTDGDGYGAGDAVQLEASTAPTGYSVNNTDCAPTDATKNASFPFYADADNDGYGAGSSVSVCAVSSTTAPTGYSANNTDCDDTKAAVHPGATETANGIDDNCNGTVDEGLAPAAPTAGAGACVGSPVTGAATALPGYSLKWYTVATGGTAAATTPLATTKAVKYYVSQKLGTGTESARLLVTVTGTPVSTVKTITGFAPICIGGSKTLTLKTGSVGSIHWQSSTTSATATDFANITGATTTSYVASPAATTWYRVESKNGACSSIASAAVVVTVSQLAAVGTLSSNVSTVCKSSGTTLTLASATGTIAWQKATVTGTTVGIFKAVAGNVTTTLATGNLTATTAYKVVVSSGACAPSTSDVVTVTVSPLALAKVIAANTTSNTSAKAICTTLTKPLTYATTGSVGLIQWQSAVGATAPVATSTAWTDIANATSATYEAASSAAGNVWFRVKLTSGVCSAPAYSKPVNVWFKSCTPIARISPDAFKVVAYPNPSTEGFTIKSNNGKSFGVQVYDMLGRSIEQRQLKSDSQIGSNYAKGIYNVIVTQDAQVKTLRVIKQ